MQSFSEDEIRQIFGETFFDTQKVILEYVKDIPNIIKKVKRMDNKLDNIEADIKTIKLAVKDTSSQLWDHEDRINKLELKTT